jgi:hypothetical protein
MAVVRPAEQSGTLGGQPASSFQQRRVHPPYATDEGCPGASLLDFLCGLPACILVFRPGRSLFAGHAAQSEDIVELLDLAAQRRYKAFLRSEDRCNLHDAALDKMLSIRLALNVIAVVLFIAVLVRLALRFAPI